MFVISRIYFIYTLHDNMCIANIDYGNRRNTLNKELLDTATNKGYAVIPKSVLDVFQN